MLQLLQSHAASHHRQIVITHAFFRQVFEIDRITNVKYVYCQAPSYANKPM